MSGNEASPTETAAATPASGNGSPAAKKIIALVIVIIIFLVGRKYWRAGDGDTAPVAEVPRPVKVMTIGKALDMAPRTFPGRIQASREAELSFEVAGKLKVLKVKQGEEIKQGALLAKLNDADYRNRLAQAKAKALEAEQQFRRSEKLVKQGVITPAQFDQQKATFDSAQAEARLAEKALADTTLSAPFNGTVARLHVENHESVQAKQAIMTFQDLKELEVAINVPERDIYYAKKSQIGTLAAVLEADPKKEHELTFKEISTEADSVTQTYEVTLTMAAPKGVNLLPGMTAQVIWRPAVADADKATAFTVPVTAVRGDETGKSFVWTVDKSSMRLKELQVQIGEMTGDQILITDGLAKGQTILTAGVHYARDNMLVSFLPAGPDAGRGGK